MPDHTALGVEPQSLEFPDPAVPQVQEALAKPLRLGDPHRPIGQLDLASRLD